MRTFTPEQLRQRDEAIIATTFQNIRLTHKTYDEIIQFAENRLGVINAVDIDNIVQRYHDDEDTEFVCYAVNNDSHGSSDPPCEDPDCQRDHVGILL